MKTNFVLITISLVCLLCSISGLLAQGNVGINTNDPVAMLHVKDSSVVFSGSTTIPANPGAPPMSGPGVRMMWYPDKAAFRAGSSYGSHWDKEKTGNYSFAVGVSNVASGFASSALGAENVASGYLSTSIGAGSKAFGEFSTTIGRYILSRSYICTVMGQWNDTTNMTSPYAWDPLDPIFVVGIGNGHSLRKNGFTVLKNARTGINISNPASMLHVVRSGLSGGPYDPLALATFESNEQSYLHLSHPNTVETGLLSGNQSGVIRRGLAFGIDSSMVFKTGGNFIRAKLDKTGKLGLNTTSPQTFLHINKFGGGTTAVHPNAAMKIQSTNSAYMQFSVFDTSGVIHGSGSGAFKSGILFLPDLSIKMYTGSDLITPAITVAADGEVGIQTNNPQATLDINGSIRVGNTGTLVNDIVRFTMTKDLPIINGGNSYTEIFANANVTNNGNVLVCPETVLSDGLVIAYAYTEDGEVRVKFTNTTASAINPASITYRFTVIQ